MKASNKRRNKMNKDELKTILDNHEKWLNDIEGGEQANLSRADLREADLRGANLSRANLREANLREADLREANLSGVDLREADLSRADLSGANLSRADLSGANLSRANLREANLREADLREANLSRVDLREADLRGADLRKADLRFLCSADGKIIATMNAGKYQVVVSKEKIAIDCQFHTVKQWKSFSDKQISQMDDGAVEWWGKWKDLVISFHENIFGGDE